MRPPLPRALLPSRPAAPQGGGNPPLPLLFVLHNKAANQVLLFVRSTVSPYEWGANFQYNAVRAGRGECVVCGRACMEAATEPPQQQRRSLHLGELTA